jgi:hypothetical protein
MHPYWKTRKTSGKIRRISGRTGGTFWNKFGLKYGVSGRTTLGTVRNEHFLKKSLLMDNPLRFSNQNLIIYQSFEGPWNGA